MYLSVLFILIGCTLSFESFVLAFYSTSIFGAFRSRILNYEEPELERVFGSDWLRYKMRVNRWL